MHHNLLTSMRFMFLWVVGTVGTILLTLFVAIIALIATSIVTGILAITHAPIPALIMGVCVSAFVGLIMGMLTGWFQGGLIRQKFNVALRGWFWWSVAGGIVGMIATLLILGAPLGNMLTKWTIPTRDTILLYSALPALIPMICLSSAQWFALQPYVRSAWLWVVANAVAGLAVFALLAWSFSNPMIILSFISLIFVFAAPGIITGFAILWLFIFLSRD